jgi:hypothetical protein
MSLALYGGSGGALAPAWRHGSEMTKRRDVAALGIRKYHRRRNLSRNERQLKGELSVTCESIETWRKYFEMKAAKIEEESGCRRKLFPENNGVKESGETRGGENSWRRRKVIRRRENSAGRRRRQRRSIVAPKAASIEISSIRRKHQAQWRGALGGGIGVISLAAACRVAAWRRRLRRRRMAKWLAARRPGIIGIFAPSPVFSACSRCMRNLHYSLRCAGGSPSFALLSRITALTRAARHIA